MSQHHSSRHHVVVVGRSPEKMRQALQVLESAGFAATGTFNRDEAMAAITAQHTLFAVVAGAPWTTRRRRSYELLPRPEAVRLCGRTSATATRPSTSPTSCFPNWRRCDPTASELRLGPAPNPAGGCLSPMLARRQQRTDCRAVDCGLD
jgi:hypothetical protein